MKTKAIYIIICTKNNTCYIGKTKNITSRLYKHFGDLKNNKHNSYLLQKYYNEFGQNSITMKVLEYVNDVQLLKEREKYYIDTMKPKLNTYIGYKAGINKRSKRRKIAI